MRQDRQENSDPEPAESAAKSRMLRVTGNMGAIEFLGAWSGAAWGGLVPPRLHRTRPCMPLSALSCPYAPHCEPATLFHGMSTYAQNEQKPASPIGDMYRHNGICIDIIQK
jgi:hypothetical protein